jgi:MAC/Perforin domain
MDQIPGASMLGFGFNILGRYSLKSATKAILTPPSGSNGTYTDPYSNPNKVFTIPQNVSVTQGSGNDTQSAQVEVAESQQDFQSYLASKAGISASSSSIYGQFSGEFDFAFSNTEKSQTMYWYCLSSGSFESWTVVLEEAGPGQFATDFANDPDVVAMKNQTSFTQENQFIFFRVFNKWGTHFIDQIVMGGNFNYFTSVESSYSSDQTTISSNISLEYKTLFIDTQAQAQVDWNTLGQSWSDSRQVSWHATGGNTSMLSSMSASPGYGDNFSQPFQSWVSSIGNSPGMVGFHLTPISNLFSGTLSAAISQALSAYMGVGAFTQATMTITSSTGPVPGSQQIYFNGQVLTNPATSPPSGSTSNGLVQVAVFDGQTLNQLANVGGYYYYDQSGAHSPWDQILQSLQSITAKSYLAVLSLYGFPANDGYPPSGVINWLAGCGATLQAWGQNNSLPSGDEYGVNYVMVGQQGSPRGSALEKFFINSTPGGEVYGTFEVNLTAPLLPPMASGLPYKIFRPTLAANVAEDALEGEPAGVLAGASR